MFHEWLYKSKLRLLFILATFPVYFLGGSLALFVLTASVAVMIAVVGMRKLSAHSEDDGEAIEIRFEWVLCLIACVVTAVISGSDVDWRSLRKSNNEANVQAVDNAAHNTSDEPYRTWTRVTDGKTVRAQLVGKRGGQITLRRPDGKTFTIEISDLSQTDGAYVRNSEFTR